MAVELGSVRLEHLTHVEVHEAARLRRHPVPGMSGELVQELGRPAVAIRMTGLFYGASAADDLKQLRDAYLARQPVDFFAAAVGEGYFAQVMIERLDVAERAGDLDQFHYSVEVREYTRPPEPAAIDPLGGIDTGLLDEASGFMDSVQNAIDEVSQLGNLLSSIPSFGDPTSKLPSILDDYTPAAGEAGQALSALRDLL